MEGRFKCLFQHATAWAASTLVSSPRCGSTYHM